MTVLRLVPDQFLLPVESKGQKGLLASEVLLERLHKCGELHMGPHNKLVRYLLKFYANLKNKLEEQ